MIVDGCVCSVQLVVNETEALDTCSSNMFITGTN